MALGPVSAGGNEPCFTAQEALVKSLIVKKKWKIVELLPE